MSSRIAQWHAVVSCGCGVAAALAMHLLADRKVTYQAPPEPVRVSIKAALRQAPQVVPPAAEILPLKGAAPAALPKKAPPKPVALPKPEEPVSEDVPAAVSAPAVLDLVQPQVAPEGPTAALSDMPKIGPADMDAPPPKPAEDAFISQYDDAPGGRIVVIAVLVNHEGDVVDAKVVIPSRYALKDLGLVFASRQQKVSALTPPLAPGEVRWLEMRLEYPDETKRESFFP